ncbi:MAG: DUF4276 family protein [Verrucomicrobia bacterium]|nr:DUF4276 family protein [Verrucomicrobiota bacterium]
MSRHAQSHGPGDDRHGGEAVRPSIVPIVEGHAEIETIPVLLRRILAEDQIHDVQAARPFRVKRSRITRKDEIEKAIQTAVANRETPGGVIVVLDADDDCPAELGPALLGRCRSVTSVPVRVVIANRELEAWFLGAKESLRVVRGVHADATAPPLPESLRGAKEELSKNMSPKRYLEVDDQPALAEKMDFASARTRCRSFDKFLRDVRSLVEETRSRDSS